MQLRPLLSEARGTSLDQFSTRVELYVASKQVEQLLTVYQVPQTNLTVGLSELVAHLCPCLDCDVWVVELQQTRKLAHSSNWYQADALPWIREITFANPRADQNIDSYLARIAPLVRILNGPDGVPCGRAAIGFGYIEAGIQSIGGLASSADTRAVHSFSMAYVGSMGFEPAGPRRNAGPIVGANVEGWASEQAALLAQTEVDEFEKYLAAMNVAQFGGDPTPIAMILINRKPTTLAGVYKMLAAGKAVTAAVSPSVGRQLPTISMVMHWRSPGHGEGLGSNELDFAVATMEAWSSRRVPDQHYHQIPTEKCRRHHVSCRV